MYDEEYKLLLSVIRFSRSAIKNRTYTLWCNVIQERKSIYDNIWDSLIANEFVIYSERNDKDLINYSLTEKAIDYIADKENIIIDKIDESKMWWNYNTDCGHNHKVGYDLSEEVLEPEQCPYCNKKIVIKGIRH